MKFNSTEYQEKYNQLKAKSDFASGLAQTFVSELLSLPPQDRFTLLPLFKLIEEDAFAQGFEIQNLDYSTLEDEKVKWEKSLNTAQAKPKEKKVPPQDDFNKVLYHFFSKYDLALHKVKGYFLFRAENLENSATRVRILYDDEFNKHPEINSFDLGESEYDLKKYKLSEFVNLVSTDVDARNQNYLFVFLVTSHLRDRQDIIEEIKGLLDLFSNCDYVAIKSKPVLNIRDFEFKTKRDGISRIDSYSCKIFNNRELTFEEEAIIKKLFPGKEMILDYKMLKGGNSGSKVIEIQPLKVDYPAMVRFVTKIAPLDDDRKIRLERDRFREHITLIGVPNYSSNYDETENHEAILYNYASSDSKRDSNPFAKIITDKINDKYDYHFTPSTVIEELFSCEPYKLWDTGRYLIEEPVKVLYADYLRSEGRVFKAISTIKGLSLEVVMQEEIAKDYNQIKEYILKTNKKICHGDLHTENFFKDDKGVYLIDFGWTNKLHSVIDHATLECSLKFKHLPFYVSIEELLEYEKKFLEINSFSTSYSLSFIKRVNVAEMFKLIGQVREKAKAHMVTPDNVLEYLISLFIISFRQIQYSDLNQRYALASAELLAKGIREMI